MGPQDPGPAAQWIGYREATMMGASSRMLSYWTQRGHVRWKGEIQARRYLLRDVAVRVAMTKRRR